MSNRVEELESRVTELQAAVDGLTEELVETRERLRALETDADGATGGPRNEPVTPAGAPEPATGSAQDSDRDPEPEAEAEAETETDTAAEAGADANADAPADADAETDDGSSSDSDDIIVA